MATLFGQDRIGELSSVLETRADNGNHVVESPGSGNLTSHNHNDFMVLLACNLLSCFVLIFCVCHSILFFLCPH